MPHPRSAIVPMQTGYRLVALIALLTIMACSTDAPDRDSSSASSEAQASTRAAPKIALPVGFPEQIPLPDDHIIVRDSSRMTEVAGQEIAINIALPGRVEEWVPPFQDALEREFQGVKFRETHNSLQWRFHGHGFEYAVLYLNDNQGYLDRGSIDSTHLPVMLTLNMMERRPGQ